MRIDQPDVNNGVETGTKQLKLRAESADKQTKAAKKVAREFEAYFATTMLKAMRATVGKDELTGGGRGEEIFRSLLDEQYAKAVAEQGSLGLARIIERELQRQESRSTVRNAGRAYLNNGGTAVKGGGRDEP